MTRYWRYVLMFSIESSCVVVLRTMKLASGGVPAFDEACRIVTEKAVAMGETSVRARTRQVASRYRFGLPAGREKQSSPSLEINRNASRRPRFGA
jgi:hypothetical protein